jgi:hypothetical protein
MNLVLTDYLLSLLLTRLFRSLESSILSTLITNCAFSASIQVDEVFRAQYNTWRNKASKSDVVLAQQQIATLCVTHALNFNRVSIVCTLSFCYSRYGVIYVYNIYGGGIISVFFRIISVVCGAASDTEYAALFSIAQLVYYYRIVTEACGYPQCEPSPIYVDNDVARGIANHFVKVKRSKSIDKSFHYIRDRVELGDVEMALMITSLILLQKRCHHSATKTSARA